jgi:hypothetical protein
MLFFLAGKGFLNVKVMKKKEEVVAFQTLFRGKGRVVRRKTLKIECFA